MIWHFLMHLLINATIPGGASWLLQQEGHCIFRGWGALHQQWTHLKIYSFASCVHLFPSSFLLVPAAHIIKHIIITWLSAAVSARSILALPGNQFVVTLCNLSKVIKWNELQLQRAFKKTRRRMRRRGAEKRRKMTTRARNIPPRHGAVAGLDDEILMHNLFICRPASRKRRAVNFQEEGVGEEGACRQGISQSWTLHSH